MFSGFYVYPMLVVGGKVALKPATSSSSLVFFFSSA